MLNGKVMKIRLIVGQIKKDIVQMGEYFPKPNSFRANVNVALDLSNYATKSKFQKTATRVDVSSFVKKQIQRA